MSLLALWPAIPALIIALVLHTAYMDWVVEPEQKHALEDQAKTLTEQCQADKKITEGVSHDYQEKNDALARKLAAIKLRKPSKCVPLASYTAGHSNAASTGEPARQNGGITTDSLYDFAAEAEQYRLRLEGCQTFIRDVWEFNNQ